MITTPFLYDSIYHEITSVYLNKYNTLHGRAAFNKRYLQENVLEMFLVLLSLIVQVDFGVLVPATGEFNAPEILKALNALRKIASPQVSELLGRYVCQPLERLPTPIQLAAIEGMPVEYNSYFGHSKIGRAFYYPFEDFL